MIVPSPLSIQDEGALSLISDVVEGDKDLAELRLLGLVHDAGQGRERGVVMVNTKRMGQGEGGGLCHHN
jgi:hypothetical protein